MAASIVRVHRSCDFAGTGFVCYSSVGRCLVMTVAEAVGSRRSNTIGLPNQRADMITAQLVGVNRDTNLALLSFVPTGGVVPPALEFADWRTADLNSGAVVVRGYYFMGRDVFLQAPGVFRGDIRGDALWRENVHTLRCDYTGADGLRGAPVIQAGRVIGVHSRSEGRLQVATSVCTVRDTLVAWLRHHPALANNGGIYDMLAMIAAANP